VVDPKKETVQPHLTEGALSLKYFYYELPYPIDVSDVDSKSSAAKSGKATSEAKKMKTTNTRERTSAQKRRGGRGPGRPDPMVVAVAKDQIFAAFKPYNFEVLEPPTLECILRRLQGNGKTSSSDDDAPLSLVGNDEQSVGDGAGSAGMTRAAAVVAVNELYTADPVRFAKRAPKRCGLLIGHIQPLAEVATRGYITRLTRILRPHATATSGLMAHSLVVNMPYYSLYGVLIMLVRRREPSVSLRVI
jgi:hypothetical protein